MLENIYVAAIGLIGWVAAIKFGIENYYLQKQVEKLTVEVDNLNKAQRLDRDAVQAAFHAMAEMLRGKENAHRISAKVDAIFAKNLEKINGNAAANND